MPVTPKIIQLPYSVSAPKAATANVTDEEKDKKRQERSERMRQMAQEKKEKKVFACT